MARLIYLLFIRDLVAKQAGNSKVKHLNYSKRINSVNIGCLPAANILLQKICSLIISLWTRGGLSTGREIYVKTVRLLKLP